MLILPVSAIGLMIIYGFEYNLFYQGYPLMYG
ncbi:hypothetical protein VIAE108258_04215 [Vibrio aerogenes]